MDKKIVEAIRLLAEAIGRNAAGTYSVQGGYIYGTLDLVEKAKKLIPKEPDETRED